MDSGRPVVDRLSLRVRSGRFGGPPFTHPLNGPATRKWALMGPLASPPISYPLDCALWASSRTHSGPDGVRAKVEPAYGGPFLFRPGSAAVPQALSTADATQAKRTEIALTGAAPQVGA